MKKIDDVSKVTGSGILPALTATFHLAPATIVFRPVSLAQPLIELAETYGFGRGGVFLPPSRNNRPPTGRRWPFLAYIVDHDCLIEVLCAL